MNQNERDDLPIYLGLQEFELALVEVEASRLRGRIKVMSLVRRCGAYRCPDCGRKHAEGLFEETQSIRKREAARQRASEERARRQDAAESVG